MIADLEPEEEVDGRPLGEVLPSAQGLIDELPALVRAELAELMGVMRDYAKAAQAPNTSRAYASDWRLFEAWCERYGLLCLPAAPGTVALYLTSLGYRRLRTSTIRRRAAAITRVHRNAGHPSPLWDPRVTVILEGIARSNKDRRPNKKVALLRDPLVSVVAQIDTSATVGLRDRALLLVGFALGLRRSELVALQVEDLTAGPDGLSVMIRSSKTDQQGHGHTLLLVHATGGHPCPVLALREWLAAAQISTGAVFRRVTRTGAVSSPLSAPSVGLIVKRRVAQAGLASEDSLGSYGGHSLRSGYATQAARDGYPAGQIADVTRHRDQRVLAGYIEAGKGAATVARVL